MALGELQAGTDRLQRLQLRGERLDLLPGDRDEAVALRAVRARLRSRQPGL
jgi:hypothetical protein